MRGVRHPGRAPHSLIRRCRSRLRKGHLKPDTTAFARDAHFGPVAALFHEIRTIPGWFTYDDAAHFSLILSMQSGLGIPGDILEIGSFHGRSTALLARYLADGETLMVCDPFDSGEVYVANPPSEKQLRRNVGLINPDMNERSLQVMPMFSSELAIPEGQEFRFVHVDGSHVYQDVLKDLRLVSKFTCRGGVIAIDDYNHPDWPGVSEATDQFLNEISDFVILADLNRRAESGRKLYLLRV